MSAAAAEEPAVPGALRLPHPLQHIPTPGEEKLLAALLRPLDGTGALFCFSCDVSCVFQTHGMITKQKLIRKNNENGIGIDIIRRTSMDWSVLVMGLGLFLYT